MNTRFFISLMLACGLGALLFGVASCGNPLDISEKTTHIDNPKPVVVTADSIELNSVEGTDSDDALRRTYHLAADDPWADSTRRFKCIVDTARAVPRLTLHADLVPTAQYQPLNSYSLQRLIIHIDTMNIDGETVYQLCGDDLSAVIGFNKKVGRRDMVVLDTVKFDATDDYNFGYLSQNKVSGKRVLRLNLDFQAVSNLDSKYHVGRLRALAKIHY